MTDCWDKDPHRRPRFERLKRALKGNAIEKEEMPPPATLPRRPLVEATRPSNREAYQSSRGRRDAQSRLYGRQPDIFRYSSDQSLAPPAYADAVNLPARRRGDDSGAQP